MVEPDRNSRRTRLLLLALLVAVKSLFVVVLADVFFYGEELEKGTVAKALIDGLGLPYHELVYHEYEGGGFVVSHLKALAFLLVGESVLAHKLVAILTCALVFWAGLALVERHFGRRAATLFGLLFIFGPGSFQRLSMLSLGIHFEASFFVLIVLDRAFTLAFDRGSGTRRDVVALGLAAGFGTYFSYQVPLVALYATGLFLLFRRELVFGRLALVGLGAFAVGVLPLVWMAANVGGAVFDIHGTELAAPGGGLAPLGEFLRSIYMDWGAREGGPIAMLGVVLYPLAALGAVAWALGSARGVRRRKALGLVGFLGFWLAVYVASGFVQGAVYHWFQFMRFAPFTIVALALVAAALGAGAPRGVRFPVAILLAFGLLQAVMIVMDASPRTIPENVRVLAVTKGYDYSGFAAKLLKRRPRTPEGWAPLVSFEEPSRELLFAELAEEAYRDDPRPFAAVVRELEGVGGAGWRDFLRGLGRYVMLHAGGDLNSALAATNAIENGTGRLLAEALGRTGKGFAVTPDAIRAEVHGVLDSVDGEARAAYLEGVGARVCRRMVVGPYSGALFALEPQAARGFVVDLAFDAGDREHLLAGFDAEWARRTLRR